MAARIFITSFVCLLSVLIAIGIYSHHHAKPDWTDQAYTIGAFALGILVPAFWIVLYDLACFVTFVALGLFGVVAGATQLTWLSFAELILLVGGYAFLLYLDKRFPRLFPAKLPLNSPFVPMAIGLGGALVQGLPSVGFIIGGGFILYLSLGSLLVAWRPSLGRVLGIRLIRPPNPAVQGTLRDKAAQRL